MYIAHKREDGQLQLLEEHLKQVAILAKSFAEGFGAGDYAYVLGLAHDIGKYSAAFQEYLLKDGMGGDHSTAGAKDKCFQRHCVRQDTIRASPTEEGRVIHRGCQLGKAV